MFSHQRMWSLLRLVIFGAVVLRITAARAQTEMPKAEPYVTVDTVKIRIEQMNCGDLPSLIYIVIDDADQHEYQARREGLVWVAGTRKFNALKSHASVRYDLGRSDCERARVERDPADPDKSVARFDFTCNKDPVRKVTIRTTPTTDLSYVRDLRSGRVPCREHAPLRGSGTVNALRFPVETLLLQLGKKKPDLEHPGLYVDESVRKHARKTAGGLLLKRERIVDALFEQRARQRASVPPRLSGREQDQEWLEKLGLENLELMEK